MSDKPKKCQWRVAWPSAIKIYNWAICSVCGVAQTEENKNAECRGAVVVGRSK